MSQSTGSQGGGNGNLASDIITYIGVPLAVLGVLPILYNTAVTLAALSRIRRTLRQGRLAGLVRGDVVNRVIEVELPRYAVAPLPRRQAGSSTVTAAAYWQVATQPSTLPGGSWTALNWRTQAVGSRVQRVEYADQLRLPQAEVAFDALVAYLLDLGARPDPRAWKLLRATGLWTPVGCALLLAPDGRSEPALAIAPLDDSDGHLSLRLTWSQDWITRDPSSLPPYWVRLPTPPRPPRTPAEQAPGVSASDAGSTSASMSRYQPVSEGSNDASGDEYKRKAMPNESVDSILKQAERHLHNAIACRISVDGLVTAVSEEADEAIGVGVGSGSDGEFATGGFDADTYTDDGRTLYAEHLRIRPGGGGGGSLGEGVWFASAATAYGTTSQTVLWSYVVPGEVLGFARRETVPCGVLELLGFVDGSQTPTWDSGDASGEHGGGGGGGWQQRDREARLELFIRRNADRQLAVQAESRLPPAERQAAAALRMQREAQLQMQDMRDQRRLETQRFETRETDALQSPRWDAKKVAGHCLLWLHEQERHESGKKAEGVGKECTTAAGIPGDAPSLRDAAGMMLHRMVLDGAFAASVCAMLDLWKAWADNGGMRRSDLTALRADPTAFARASLIVAIICDAATAHEGTLAADLQECLAMWRTVRLG